MAFLGLTRDQVVVLLAVAAVWLGFDFAVPFLPLYVQELGVQSLSEAALWSGLLISLSPAASAVVGPLWGALADRYGAKPMMLRVLVVFTSMLALMGLATQLWHLAVLRLAIGLLGGFAPLAVMLMVTSGPRARTAQALGVMQAVQALSPGVGPAVGGVVADHLGLRVNFGLAAAFCLAALLLVALLMRTPGEPPAGRRSQPSAKGGPLLGILRNPAFLVPFWVLFTAHFVDRSFLPVLPLYVTALGAQPEAVASSTGLVLAAGAVATAVSGLVLGRLASRYSLARLTALALLAGLLLCGVVATVEHFSHLLVARAALGLLAGGLPTLAFTLGTRTVAADQLGRQTGLLTSAMFLANATGPFVAGLLAAWHLRFVFAADAALLGVALSFLLVATRQRRAGGLASRSPAGE